MRLIADGTVDRDGVGGLAARLGYTTRQLDRLLLAEVGAGPLALARAQRAQTARMLDRDHRPAVRRRRVRRRLLQHPPVQRHRAPGVRKRTDGAAQTRGGPIRVRRDFAWGTVSSAAGTHAFCLRWRLRSPRGRRRPRLRGGPRRRVPAQPAASRRNAVVTLTPAVDHVRCLLVLDDFRDLTTAIARCRRLLDLDADPEAMVDALSRGPLACPRGEEGSRTTLSPRGRRGRARRPRGTGSTGIDQGRENARGPAGRCLGLRSTTPKAR